MAKIHNVHAREIAAPVEVVGEILDTLEGQLTNQSAVPLDGESEYGVVARFAHTVGSRLVIALGRSKVASGTASASVSSRISAS